MVTQQAFIISMAGLWLSFFILHPLFTSLLKDKKQKWGAYWEIYFLTLVISGLILYFLITSPDKFASFINSIPKLFSNN